MNKVVTNFVFILIGIWSIITLQSMFFAIVDESNFFTKLSFTIRLSIETLSIFFLFKYWNIPKSNVFNIILTFILYSLFVNLFYSDRILGDMSIIIWWWAIFVLFYFISYNDDNKKNYIQTLMKWFPLFFLVIFIGFLFIINAQQKILGIGFFSDTNVQSNQVFFVCLLLPFVSLIKIKGLKYFLFILALYAAIFSSKRSAMICTFIVFIVSSYYDFLYHRKNKVVGFIIFSVLIIIGYNVFIYLNDRYSNFFLNRFEGIVTDQGSGRTTIMSSVVNRYFDQPIEKLLFGSGFDGVIKDKVFGGGAQYFSAHNDFLEVLYDFGFLGFILYIIFVILLLRNQFKLKLVDRNLFIANYLAFIIFIVMSLVSHLILYPYYCAYLAALWGITEGKIQQQKSTNIKIQCSQYGRYASF